MITIKKVKEHFNKLQLNISDTLKRNITNILIKIIINKKFGNNMRMKFFVQVRDDIANTQLYYICLIALEHGIALNQKYRIEFNNDNEIATKLGLTLQEYQDIITNQFNHTLYHKQIYFESASDCKKVVNWFNKNLDLFITMKSLE